MHFLLLLPLLLSQGASSQTLVLRGAAQGTTYHIKLVTPAGGVDAKRLKSDVEKILAEIDLQMSTYRSDSQVSRFNRTPQGEWFGTSEATVELVAAARDISEKTGGALDVTVGPLVRLWHFGPQNVARSNEKHPFEPPADAALRAVQKHIGYKLLDVRSKPPALRKQVEGLELDLSSIASGYTIDRLSQLLGDRGIRNFMVELGGEVRAAGKRPDGTPWRVAIERPLLAKREMETAVPLVNAAIATAGGNRKFFEYNGRRYSHIIDPATGRPVEHALASVTVVADTCTAADAWDTPLAVLGPKRGYECAEKHGIAALFISNTDKGEAVRKTSAWRKRFGAVEK